MKHIDIFSFVASLFSSLILNSAHADSEVDVLTNKELKLICEEIIEAYDYDSGSSIRLCTQGKFLVLNTLADERGVESRSVGTLHFTWEGKTSKHQRNLDSCTGILERKETPIRRKLKKISTLTSLECQ
jgi:hypothetical protein